MHDSVKKSRTRRKIWLFTLLIVLLTIIGIVIYRVTGDRALQKRLDAIRASGYPTTLEELAEDYALPAGTPNAADDYLKAFEQIVKWPKEALQKLPIVGEANLPPRTDPLPTAMKQEIERYLDDNQATLNLLHQGAKIPDCRYPVDFTSASFQEGSLWLKGLRECTMMIQLEALYHQDNGDTDKSLQSLHTGLALSKHLRVTNVLEHLVRQAILNVHIRTTEYILNKSPLEERQLQDLANIIAAEDVRISLRDAMIGERCQGVAFFLSQNPGLLGETGDMFPMLTNLAEIRQTLGFLQRDAVDYLNFMQTFIDALSLPPGRAEWDPNELDPSQYGPFTNLLIPAFARVKVLYYQTLAHQRTSLTALAVERYRLEHEEIPKNLNQLVPNYLDTVPTDPYDGQPLRYRPLDTGYVVYAIGDDHTDNGGQERRQNNRDAWDVTFTVER